MTAYTCIACGCLCLVYFVLISVYTIGAYSKLELIWLAAAIILLGAGIAIQAGERMECGWVKFLRQLLAAGIIGCILIAAYPLAGVIRTMHAKAEPGLEYLIVLGAHIYEDKPTKSLKRRLDAAYGYAQENPETVLILSGGQGSDEIMSEAACMKQYLIEQGMDEVRLILEDRSTTTYENLLFSNEITGCKSKKTGILSNDFHVFRAVSLAEKQEYLYAYPIPASSDPVMQVHYVVREIMAWWLGKWKGLL